MNKITTIGLDLAKNIFHAICLDKNGKQISKKMLRRSEVLHYFIEKPVCLIGMEACASAHHWARQLEQMGHQVKLIPPQFVTPFVRGNKNDYNDALAIAEALTRPQMRFASIKTTAQQDVQALHRLRASRVQERTALCNQVRGLLGEYGIIIPIGVRLVRKELLSIMEDGENGLSDMFRQHLLRIYQQLQEIDEHIKYYTDEVMKQVQGNEVCKQLQTIPGFGPIVASVFYSIVGNGKAYKRGRDVSASLGLVPRQHSSGGHDRLLGISKRGDGYMRSLMVHGARAVVIQAARKDDHLSQWINKVKAKRGHNKAVVALANKMARIGWSIIAHKTTYQVN